MSDDSFKLAAKLVAGALSCPEDSIDTESALGVHPQWDSISHLNVMMALEEAFGTPIDDMTIEKYQTLYAIQALYAAAP